MEDFGQAELLYRNGVYFLYVRVSNELDVPEPAEADTLGGVDINEFIVALTALVRNTIRKKGTLVHSPVRTPLFSRKGGRS